MARRAVQIVVRWGESVLRVERLRRGDVARGGLEPSALGVDGYVPREVLEELGRRVARASGAAEDVAQAIQAGDMIVEASLVPERERAKGEREGRRRRFAALALAFGAHAALVGAFVAFHSPLEDEAAIASARDDRLAVEARLTRAESVADEEHEASATAVDDRDTSEAPPSERQHAPQMGEFGTGKTVLPFPRARHPESAAVVSPDGPPVAEFDVALGDARTFGMIGLLGADRGRRTDALGGWISGQDERPDGRAYWGASDLTDSDAALSLSGIGEGGGGRGRAIGLGDIGTIGFGRGRGRAVGIGSPFGDSDGNGRLPGSHRTRAPVVCNRTCGDLVSGRLPAESIERIIRQNAGRFRLCYEQVLQENPCAEGRIEVAFVIGGDGSVTSSALRSSTFHSATIDACVVRAFAGLSFPAPDGGIVTVGYPIVFTPLDG